MQNIDQLFVKKTNLKSSKLTFRPYKNVTLKFFRLFFSRTTGRLILNITFWSRFRTRLFHQDHPITADCRRLKWRCSKPICIELCRIEILPLKSWTRALLSLKGLSIRVHLVRYSVIRKALSLWLQDIFWQDSMASQSIDLWPI